MSIKVMTYVWEHSKAKSGSLLVLLALADCASAEEWTAWPSVAYLARRSRLSERQVQRALRDLVSLGEIEVLDVGGVDGKSSHFVRVTKCHPIEGRGDVGVTPGVTFTTGRGDVDVTPFYNEPSIKNRNKNRNAQNDISWLERRYVEGKRRLSDQ